MLTIFERGGMNGKKLISALIIGLGVAGGALAISVPALGSESRVLACTLSTGQPNSNLVGTATRSGCSQVVTLEIFVGRDISFAPDPGEKGYAQAGNGTWNVDGNCHGSGNYYTEAWTYAEDRGHSTTARVQRC